MKDSITIERVHERSGEEGIRVDFLYWEDCPSHEQALTLLHDVLDNESIPANVTVREVETDSEAERLHFPGSPTIRVNGHDIEPNVDESVVGLTCRAYRTPAGKITPLPPRNLIVDALRGAQSERR
jgi:hypothetical protein